MGVCALKMGSNKAMNIVVKAMVAEKGHSILIISGVAKPRHTRARARATFAWALAFACRSFKLAPRAKESARDRKRRGSEGLACLYVLARAFLRAE